jgi:hypothetical protein
MEQYRDWRSTPTCGYALPTTTGLSNGAPMRIPTIFCALSLTQKKRSVAKLPSALYQYSKEISNQPKNNFFLLSPEATTQIKELRSCFALNKLRIFSFLNS